MALGADDLQDIEQLIMATAANASLFAELRHRFPHLALTRCDASELTEPPFLSFPGFDLHLIDGSNRCAQITVDPARATGVVLATRRIGP
ncbi:hypothetical protein [Bradyrhizobium genosp. P]|uniref:hypothetical protein n=1 Tax=Bradyrhizobium genosp. P TaxID=83641 RepID=UPI003CF3D191